METQKDRHVPTAFRCPATPPLQRPLHAVQTDGGHRGTRCEPEAPPASVEPQPSRPQVARGLRMATGAARNSLWNTRTSWPCHEGTNRHARRGDGFEWCAREPGLAAAHAVGERLQILGATVGQQALHQLALAAVAAIPPRRALHAQ